MGRLLILLGLLFLGAGIWISLGWRLPFRLGHLPGDIHIRGGRTQFYFPVVTCLLLSLILTLILSVLRR